MPVQLPTPIADYIAANARLDIDAMVAPFAPDAVLLDGRKRFEGTDEIRRLFEEEVIPVKAIFAPESVSREGDRIVVQGPGHGNFPGSPIDFTYRFELAGDAIAALEITA